MKRARIALLSLGSAALVALASVEVETPRRAANVVPARAAAASSEKTFPVETLEYGAAFLQQPLPRAVDPFEARSWAPPPPPAPKVAPKPVAPPLPFVFSGVMEDESGKTLFVRKGDAVLVAREHEVLDSSYRVEEIGEQTVAFTYLPLQERQVLAYPK